jgi:hypothetical protein
MPANRAFVRTVTSADYSYRSATVGAIREALRAGM